MSRFVRQSKFRHVFGKNCKAEEVYSDMRVTRNAWDSNVVSANPYFFSLNWDAGGGGAFAVIPYEQVGKVPTDQPLFQGHTAAVLDTAFNPFDDYMIASSSEDCTVKIWGIPEGGLTESVDEALQELKGHGRKVGHLLWHPTAQNVLVSNSTDLTIRFWDIETGDEKIQLTGHGANINDMSFNGDGSLLATVSKDKHIKIWDPRAGDTINEGDTHPGVKGSRCVWLTDKDKIFTVGFSKMSQRQYAVMDPRDLSTPLAAADIDSSSGILMPFYDEDTSVLFLAGKGDGNIRYYEIVDDAPYIHYLSEYTSSTPARGMCVMGKRSVDVSQCEIAKMMKVTTNSVETISFQVPRKADVFADDIFPDTRSGVAALSGEAWFGGENAEPNRISLRDGFVPTGKSETNFVKAEPEPEVSNDPRELHQRIKALEDSAAQKDVTILKLQAKIAELEKAAAPAEPAAEADADAE